MTRLKSYDNVIANFLDSQMQRLGIGPIEFARRINVSPSLVWYMRSGANLPEIDTILKISQAFGINSDAFLDICLKEKIRRYWSSCQQTFEQYKKDRQKTHTYCFVGFRDISFDFRTPLTGQFLRDHRVKKKLSVVGAALQLGIGSTILSTIESGRMAIPNHIIFSLADFYNFDPQFLFNSMMSEKIQHFSAIVHKKFHDLKLGIAIKKASKPVSSVLERCVSKLHTETSDFIYSIRSNFNLSVRKMACYLNMSQCRLSEVERGERLFNFSNIVEISEKLNIARQELFEMTLRDRLFLCSHHHNEGFRNFCMDFDNPTYNAHIRFCNDKTPYRKMSNCFLKTGEYLRRNRIKNNWNYNQISKKIGIGHGQYIKWERGSEPITFLGIEACHLLFGDDRYDVFNMVMEEKLRGDKEMYQIMWRDYVSLL